MKKKYRKIVRANKKDTDKYDIPTYLSLFKISGGLLVGSVVLFYLDYKIKGIQILGLIEQYLFWIAIVLVLFAIIISVLAYIYASNEREEVKLVNIPEMTENAQKLSKQLLKCFDYKILVDVLNLSIQTRYGIEMPNVEVWIDERDNCDSGKIYIENLGGNYQTIAKTELLNAMSGIFRGKLNRFSVVSCVTDKALNYLVFRFEDTSKSYRLVIDSPENLVRFKSENPNHLRLATDLVWRTDVVAHLSIIARTRSGKSVLAGEYIASLAKMQGWVVEYNSAKEDRYVSLYNGQSEPDKIIERAEYWCNVMDERLAKMKNDGKDKYLDYTFSEMPKILLIFDEIGNFNAGLKVDKKLEKRWITSINRLSATGASTGISLVSISQQATVESFLPSLARVNSSDAVIMLGGAAGSATERQFMVPGYEVPDRDYAKGQGLIYINDRDSSEKYSTLHYYETPWFNSLNN